jgi:hypothetical protein
MKKKDSTLNASIGEKFAIDQLIVKLTPYQKIFYNEWLLNPARSDYNMILDQYITGDLDLERLFGEKELLYNKAVDILV